MDLVYRFTIIWREVVELCLMGVNIIKSSLLIRLILYKFERADVTVKMSLVR